MPTPRKPTALLKLEGANSTRIKRREQAEPQPAIADECPFPLPELSEDAKNHWEEVAPGLHACGILSQIDLHAFGSYCEWYAKWRTAMDRVESTGMVIITEKGPKVNPYVSVADKAMKQIMALWREFGMTPASRSRIALDNALAEAADDPWAKFTVPKVARN